MMQFFRSIAKPIILVTAIAFFIWLVYDLSGLGGGTGGLLTTTSVGKVNGTTVDARTFQAQVQQAIEGRQRQSGAPMSLEEVAQVRDQVWEQSVQDIIFRAEYRRRRLSVSPDEVAEAIRTSPIRELTQSPEFQTDGQFDLAKYQRWLGSTGGQSAIPYLEDRYRDELLRSKLIRGVIGDVYVSDAALWERYRDEKEQVKLASLKLNPAVAIADEAVSVTPQEVEEYYRTHKDEFKRPRTAFLSYVSIPRLPDQSDSAAALARARTLREEIVKGAPFDEVARRESADTISGKFGGDLGVMTKEQLDPAFVAAAAALKLKTVSEPVASSFGYHLIEVESRTGNSFKSRHILIPIEVTGTHRDRLDRRADSLQQLAAERLEGSALDTAASALKLAIRKLPPLAEGNRVSAAETGNVPDAGIWSFQAKEGEHSDVIEAEQAYVVFRLDSAHAEGVPPLETIRETVNARVQLEKKRAAARELATRLADQARQGTPLRQLGQAPGIEYREIGPFARLGAPLPDPKLIGAAFSAGKNEIAGPVAVEDGVYLLQELERIPADSAEFVKNLPQIRNEALQSARQSRVRAYVTALRAEAKIVDRRAELYSQTNAQAAAAAAQAPTP
jgi:peptidyl-prolyl cis-trans isomerase D